MKIVPDYNLGGYGYLEGCPGHVFSLMQEIERRYLFLLEILRIFLHSLVLATVNVGFIIVGFRVNKLLINEIAIQTPVSVIFCIVTFVGWLGCIRRFSFKKLALQETWEFGWVYVTAFLWSPMVFASIHRLRWGYRTSLEDILFIWLFQAATNGLVLFIAKHASLLPQKLPGQTLEVRRRTWQKNLALNSLLAGGSVIVAGIVLELFLQGFYEPPPIISGWRSSCSKLEKNQLGFRGRPVKYSPDDIVIVLLGDSQVEAEACSYWWIPERRLQYYLNSFGKHVKVFTLGTRGYGQDQQLLVLQEYYETYRANMVILWQSPANDIWNNMFPTHWPANGTPKPTFWLENGELRGPSEQLGESLQTSPIKLIELWRRAFTPVKRDNEWEQFFPPSYKPLTEYNGQINPEWQEDWNASIGLMRDENLDNEKSHYAIMLTPPSERMRYGLELTRKLTQEIETLVGSHQGEFVVFFRGSPPSNGFAIEEEIYGLNGKYYKSSKKQMLANIEYINRGFHSYEVPVTVEDYRVGPEDAHLNEHAVDQVMQDLAQVLVKDELL